MRLPLLALLRSACSFEVTIPGQALPAGLPADVGLGPHAVNALQAAPTCAAGPYVARDSGGWTFALLPLDATPPQGCEQLRLASGAAADILVASAILRCGGDLLRGGVLQASGDASVASRIGELAGQSWPLACRSVLDLSGRAVAYWEYEPPSAGGELS